MMVHRKIPNTSLNISPEYTAITILNMGRLHLKIIRLQYSNPKRLMSCMKKKTIINICNSMSSLSPHLCIFGFVVDKNVFNRNMMFQRKAFSNVRWIFQGIRGVYEVCLLFCDLFLCKFWMRLMASRLLPFIYAIVLTEDKPTRSDWQHNFAIYQH